MSGRNAKLVAVLEKTISAGVSGCPFETFLAFFPFATSEADQNFLFESYSELMQMLRSNIDAEFSKICEEMQLSPKLDRLDELFSRHQQDLKDGKLDYKEMDPMQYAKDLEAQTYWEEIRAIEEETEKLLAENSGIEREIAAALKEMSSNRKSLERTAVVLAQSANDAADALEVVSRWRQQTVSDLP
eukprot:ANDGO_08409.mRNA.1 hypothetical protein